MESKIANHTTKIYEGEKVKWGECVYGSESRYKIEGSKFGHHWPLISGREISINLQHLRWRRRIWGKVWGGKKKVHSSVCVLRYVNILYMDFNLTSEETGAPSKIAIHEVSCLTSRCLATTLLFLQQNKSLCICTRNTAFSSGVRKRS